MTFPKRIKMNRAALVLGSYLLVPLGAVRGEGTNDHWVDTSPHKGALAAANRIHLHYLNWGGAGETMLFLAGLGDSAHIFDNIAPEFTNQFHVLALTRRGFGKSDHPKAGYELKSLTDDIAQFLDALNIMRVILVGHSFGGTEVTVFARRFPTRVGKLVYLDAAYDYTAAGTDLLSEVDALEAHPSDAERKNYSALHDWFARNRPGWNDACEADFRDTRSPSSKSWSFSTTPGEIMELLEKEVFSFKPDFTKITVPALAFFADHNFNKLLASATQASRTNDVAVLTRAQKWQADQIDRFRQDVRNSKVVMLADTDHFCFIQRRQEVVRSMRTFLKGE